MGIIRFKRCTDFQAKHAYAVNIFRDWRQCTNSKQHVATIIDNRGRVDYI